MKQKEPRKLIDISTGKVISECEISYGRRCEICESNFALYNPYDTRIICPDCKSKLKVLLGKDKEVEE